MKISEPFGGSAEVPGKRVERNSPVGIPFPKSETNRVREFPSRIVGASVSESDRFGRSVRTNERDDPGTARSEVTPSDCVRSAQEFRIFCRTSSASSLVRSVQSITRFSRKTFSLYAVCARRLSIQSIQYSSYPSSKPIHIQHTKIFPTCEVKPRELITVPTSPKFRSNSASSCNAARARIREFHSLIHQSRVSY